MGEVPVGGSDRLVCEASPSVRRASGIASWKNSCVMFPGEPLPRLYKMSQGEFLVRNINVQSRERFYRVRNPLAHSTPSRQGPYVGVKHHLAIWIMCKKHLTKDMKNITKEAPNRHSAPSYKTNILVFQIIFLVALFANTRWEHILTKLIDIEVKVELSISVPTTYLCLFVSFLDYTMKNKWQP